MHEPQTTGTPILEFLEIGFDGPDDGGNPAPDDPPHRRRRGIAAAIAIALAVALASIAGVAFVALRDRAPMASAAADAAAAVPPAGMAGFAELYVTAYLTAGGGDRTGALQSFYASAPDDAGATGNRFTRHVATLAATPRGAGSWELHVAADVLIHDGVGYRSDGTHHYLIGVVASDRGFAATGLPARIAAPPRAPIAAVDGGSPIDDAGLAALVEGFLAAYLTGAGDVGAYAVPGANLAPITPAPFERLTLDTLSGRATGADTVDLHVVATGHAGSWDLRLEYRLEVDASDGVWRIMRIGTAPVSPAELRPDATPGT